MASEEPVAVTTVTDRYAAAIPSVIRSRLDIEPGDELRWHLDDGSLSVEVVRRREGVFDDFEPVDMGPTHAATDHDLGAVESSDQG